MSTVSVVIKVRSSAYHMSFGRLNGYACRADALPVADTIQNILIGGDGYFVGLQFGVAFSAGGERQKDH